MLMRRNFPRLGTIGTALIVLGFSVVVALQSLLAR